jgi:hypothetical protein
MKKRRANGRKRSIQKPFTIFPRVVSVIAKKFQKNMNYVHLYI